MSDQYNKEQELAISRAIAEATGQPVAHRGRFGQLVVTKPGDGQTRGERGLREQLLEAGFDEANAARGVRMAATGRYLGFTDIATSLLIDDRTGLLGNRLLRERIAEVAKTLPSRNVITERRTVTQARARIVESAVARAAGESRLSVCLIDEGQGSSGYYSAETLQQAAADGIFAKGLHCYIDHPTAVEAQDRPERSVRDLAGCLETAAVFRDGGLYTDVRVFASHAQFITERAPVIGMSIRADGEVIQGARGPVVQRLTKAYSADFVTHAGRGGRVMT